MTYNTLSYKKIEEYGLQFGGSIVSVLESRVTDIPAGVTKKDEWDSLCSSEDVSEPVLFLIMYNVYNEPNPNSNVDKNGNTVDEMGYTQLLVLRRIPNHAGNILMRTWSNDQIRKKMHANVCTLTNNFWYGLIKNDGSSSPGFYLNGSEPGSNSSITSVEVFLTNEPPKLTRGKIGTGHYIYIDKRLSNCYVLAKYTSEIQVSKFPISDWNIDNYSPTGLRTIVTKKDGLLNQLSLKKNLELIRARSKETEGYTFGFTFKFVIDSHIIYIWFVESWDSAKGTSVKIIYPIKEGNKIIEYGMSGYQEIVGQSYINAWESSNQLNYMICMF